MDDTQATLIRCADLLAEATALLRKIGPVDKTPPLKRTPTAEVTHGTKTMYERHLKERTMCDECRAANTEYQRTKRAAKKEA